MNNSPIATQVGGDHYKKLRIQPIEYIHANGIPFAEGNVIKYVTRWRDKGGIRDLEKAKHFIEMLIALETPAAAQEPGDLIYTPYPDDFFSTFKVRTDTTGE